MGDKVANKKKNDVKKAKQAKQPDVIQPIIPAVQAKKKK
jgi:hypothetical protein